MNISKITQPISAFAKNAAPKITGALQDDTKLASKAFKLFEPNGADNSFFGLATIMTAFVLIPRIKSALKRNPDNKEATKDEIKEILFRDVQTILIMLFGLKSLNSLIGNISTKITGVPIVNKPYKKVFDKSVQGIGNKLKNLGSNILATFNPIGGSKALDSATINRNYANFESKEEVVKLLNNVENCGGKKEKVFEKIKKSVIKSLDEKDKLHKTGRLYWKDGTAVNQGSLDKIKEVKKYFEDLKLEDFIKNGLDKDYENYLKEALNNEETNVLAFGANVVNSALKFLALGIEVGYLGFGMPKLNQKRLEKKYLSEKPIGEQRGDTFSPVNDRHVKAQEIALYSSLMK